jgi:hypothetical protein
MPNIEPPQLTDDQRVACAIYCCDKKAYPLKKRAKDKECQRLGNKKHSCVLHQLREKKGGKLTTNSRFPGILASPRYNVRGIPRTLIPDVQIGDRVIDAKFPCPSPIKNTPPIIAQPSGAGSGIAWLGKKEKEDYLEIDGVNSVEGMSPDDADKAKGNCKCGKFQ